MVGLSIDQLSIGQSASFSKTISESDVYMFAGVTGDVNPAHINESYAPTPPRLKPASLMACCQPG